VKYPLGTAVAAAPALVDEKTGFLHHLRLRAEEAPESIAILAPGQGHVTFDALIHRIDALAEWVANLGFSCDDVVAVVMPDGPELLTTTIGVASAAICAPINPALRDAEMESALVDLGARALVTHRTSAELERTASKLGIELVDAELPLNSATLQARPRPAGIALLLQTSATTGKPRLVPLRHSNLLAMAGSTLRILRLTANDRFLSMMPLFHLTGFLSSLTQLLAGGTVIATAGFDSNAFLGWLQQFQPTWYSASPALHNAILPLLEARPDVLERAPVRFVRSIGAPLPQALLTNLERALRAPVLEGYGATETGMVTSSAPPPGKRKPGSVGQSAGMDVAILNESGEFLPAGADGEIAIRGDAVIAGYHKDPEASRKAFHNGWFLTGDVGYLDDEGFLFVTGRIKDIINRGGEKVLPSEIDEALLAHPAVSDAVAFGVPHPSLGEDVAAAVVLSSGASIDETDLRRFVAQRLADFKVPRRIIFLDTIPKGPTGKARRADLAAIFLAETSRHHNPNEVLTPIQKRVRTVWKRVLRIDQIGLRDDFFAIGGDSLALVFLMADIEFQFGVDGTLLDGSEFFASPTIETLAEMIAQRAPDSAKGPRLPYVALQPLGSRIPFFAIPGADENPYYFRDLAKGLGLDQPFYVLRDTRPFAERGVYTVEQHAALYVDAIRSLRPHGPYLLGGHCYGGILAFEIARQLISRGEDVSLLALFEAPAPGYPKIRRNWKNYRRQLAAVVRGHNRATLTDLCAHARVLGRVLKRKTQGATRTAFVSTGLGSVIEPLEPVGRGNERAGRSYRLKPLDCRLVHFIAADEHHSTRILDDPRFGWRDAAGEQFSVNWVPGGAINFFKHPTVGELASRLKDVLETVKPAGLPAT